MPRSDSGEMQSPGYDKDDWITRELTAFLSSNGSINHEDEAELGVPIQDAEQHVKQAWQRQQGLGSTDPTPFDSLSAWLASHDGFRTTADGLLLLKATHTQTSLDANAAAAVQSSAPPRGSAAPHAHPHAVDAAAAPPAPALTREESPPPVQDARPNTAAAASGADDADGVTKPTPVAEAAAASAAAADGEEGEGNAAAQHRAGPGGSGSDGGGGAGIAQQHEPPEPEALPGTPRSPAAEGDYEYADALETASDGADGGGFFPAGGADVSALLGGGGEEEGEEGGGDDGGGYGDGGGNGGDEGDYGEVAPSSGAWVTSEGDVADAGAGGDVSAAWGADAGDAVSVAAVKPGGGAAAAPTSAPAARPSPSAPGAAGLATLLAVAFPGSDPVTVLRRALVEIVRERPSQRLVTFAELGVRLPHHPVAGPLWRSPGRPLPRLRDVVDGAAAVAPGVFRVERHESGTQLLLSVDVGALRVAALRRAAGAAFPGGDDPGAVRRAAAAALIDAEASSPTGRASLNMPAMGQAVIRAANEPRQRLAQARGEAFSLGAILTERRPGPGGQSYMVVEPPSNGVGGLRYARLDTERLLQDAASGQLGDLVGVPLVPLRAVSAVGAEVPAAAAGREGPAPGAHPVTSAAPAPKPGSGGGSAIPPRVKEALRAAIPEGRPTALAKRALALVAAASLGGTTGGFHAAGPDPPYSLRSSPAGIILQELGLKPPKGQMRALFDEEPGVFEAGKPSPNYLIQLVHPGLRELAARWPGEVGTAVEQLLRGKTFVGLNLRRPPALASAKEGAIAAASASPTTSAHAAAAAALHATRVPTAATAPGGNRTLVASHPPPLPPPGQPEDYYARLERALDERLSNNTASEFITRARRVLAGALLLRTYRSRGPLRPPPHSMSVKDAAALLKREFPQAYSDRKPPGVFPINVVMLAQQLSLLFIVDKGSGNHQGEWTIRLNINSLELSAGLNPTPPHAPVASAAGLHEPGNDAGWGTSESEDPNAYADGYHAADANAAAGTEPAAAAAAAPDATADTMPAAVVADILAAQPARALAAALAPTVPPDLLPDPEVHIITVPYSATHVTALAHCLSCPQIGLAVKSVGGMPAMAMLYAPAVDSLKPAAAAAAAGGGAAKPPSPAGVLPATVYVIDAAAAGPTEGIVLLASLRSLLEEPGVAKVVHGCEQLVPGLEQAVGCCVSPLLDTRVVSEMLKPLDLGGAAAGSVSAGGEEAPPNPEDGSSPQLWHLPSNWQACLTTKYWDYNMAVLQHASGTDSSWLTRPLDNSQVGMLVRAVQHLPELWSALTWLLPRLAQFCSVARAQQCRALLAPQASW